MNTLLRLALLVLGLAIVAFGASRILRGLRGDAVGRPFIPDTPLEDHSPNGLHIQRRITREGTVSFASMAAVLGGLALLVWAAFA